MHIIKKKTQTTKCSQHGDCWGWTPHLPETLMNASMFALLNLPKPQL